MKLNLKEQILFLELKAVMLWLAEQKHHHNLMNATLTDTGKSGFKLVEEIKELEEKHYRRVT